jgi:hypothetical protein
MESEWAEGDTRGVVSIVEPVEQISRRLKIELIDLLFKFIMPVFDFPFELVNLLFRNLQPSRTLQNT